MLSFAVFDDQGPARTWPARLVHLFGAGDLPSSVPVRFEDGRLVVEKSSREAAGIVVQFPVGGLIDARPDGTESLLSLRTCLLPERDLPYLLSLELTRHKVMEFLNSLEDWGMVELTPDDPVIAQFERARAMFSTALVASGRALAHAEPYTPDIDRTARAALALAVDAGEQLAVRHASQQLPERVSGRSYAEACRRFAAIAREEPTPARPVVVPGSRRAVLDTPPHVGCSVGTEVFAEPLQKAVVAACDFVCMPMRWVDIEPAEGKYDYTPTDRWIEWAVRQARLPVFGGPLIDLRAPCVPDWLYIWENDYETLRELVHDHIQHVVTRYRRTVSRWTVASGLHVNTSFKLTFEQILDLTRLSVLVVKKLHPGARIQVEVAQPWGEYHAENRRSIPPLMYAEAIVQAGLPLDAIGVRIQMGQPAPGRSTRDLMAVSNLLDAYGSFEKPIAVSAFGAPSAPVPSTGQPARDGGSWKGGWTESVQAEWLGRVATVCLAKPYVHSVCWQGLADVGPTPEMPMGGLVAPTGSPRPALARLAAVRAQLRDGRAVES